MILVQQQIWMLLANSILTIKRLKLLRLTWHRNNLKDHLCCQNVSTEDFHQSFSSLETNQETTMSWMCTLANGFNTVNLDQNSTFLSKFALTTTPTMETKNPSLSEVASKKMVKVRSTLDMQALKVGQTVFSRRGKSTSKDFIFNQLMSSRETLVIQKKLAHRNLNSFSSVEEDQLECLNNVAHSC